VILLTQLDHKAMMVHSTLRGMTEVNHEILYQDIRDVK